MGDYFARKLTQRRRGAEGRKEGRRKTLNSSAPLRLCVNLFFVFILLSFFLVSCPSEPEPEGELYVLTRDVTPNTRRLWNYLSDQYGKYTLSGQMDTAWTENGTMDMIDRVFTDTGKYPAIKGFDFIDLPHNWSNYGRNQVDEAIEWWEGKNKMKGVSPAKELLPDQPDIHGIVTFCWHWRVGANLQYNTSQTDFRIPMKDGKLDITSAAGQTIKSDLDKVAALLQLLKDQDIPVLWRPLHEAGGDNTYPNSLGWFWWGASGPGPYKALWNYMFDYLNGEKKLNNLIWVWNGQKDGWYPRDDTVDIVGYDVYTNAASPESAQDYSAQKGRFGETFAMVPDRNRMVALTENGAIPDPGNCFHNDAAPWLWFCTWNDRSGSTQGETHRNNFWTGTYHNTGTHKNKVYGHIKVITLDELPDITKYRLN
jgi:mannan endo-1,4-beta-mannosidase